MKKNNDLPVHLQSSVVERLKTSLAVSWPWHWSAFISSWACYPYAYFLFCMLRGMNHFIYFDFTVSNQKYPFWTSESSHMHRQIILGGWRIYLCIHTVIPHSFCRSWYSVVRQKGQMRLKALRDFFSLFVEDVSWISSVYTTYLFLHVLPVASTTKQSRM